MSSEYRCLMCYVSCACVNICRVCVSFTDGGYTYLRCVHDSLEGFCL